MNITYKGLFYDDEIDGTPWRVVDLQTAKSLKKAGFAMPTYLYWQSINLPFSEKGLKRVKQH